MDKVEWLESYFTMVRKAMDADARAGRYEDRAMSITASLRQDVVQTTRRNDVMGDSIAEMVDASEEAYELWLEASKRATEIQEVVSKINDDEIRQVMTLRYLHGYSWSDISMLLECSRKKVRRMCDRGIELIEYDGE